MARNSKFQTIDHFIRKYLKWEKFKSLFLDPTYLTFVAVVILILELFVNVLVVERVPYTEIDWKAYMQECEGFLNGTLDYSELKGDTGPLVYPAGFVYIYSIFYYLTNHGEYIKIGQYLFIAIYLIQIGLVFRIYKKTLKVPPYVLIISILTSYRIHSIYVLRLFNDPIAVLLLFVSLNLFMDLHWTAGSIFYSLAVSVKMNILLYAPALLLFYLTNLGLKDTLKQLTICAGIQLVLGAPFLYGNPVSYMKGSFDIGRVFNHTWTVNYRFLDLEIFECKCFHIALLCLHLILLGVFYPMAKRYFESFARLKCVQAQIQPQIDAKNRENKMKQKVKNLKRRKPPAVETLSSEQEDFLKSFENTLKKSGNKNQPPIVETAEEELHYSINFDRTNQLFIMPMFLANFIGIFCSRSLHYQFYSWYFHTLPYLIWSTPYSVMIKFLLLALIEFSWNTYPSTVFSSVLLHSCHFTLLRGIYKNV